MLKNKSLLVILLLSLGVYSYGSAMEIGDTSNQDSNCSGVLSEESGNLSDALTQTNGDRYYYKSGEVAEIVKRSGIRKNKPCAKSRSIPSKDLVNFLEISISAFYFDKRIDADDLKGQIGKKAYNRLKKVYASQRIFRTALLAGRSDQEMKHYLLFVTKTLFGAEILRYPVFTNQDKYKRDLVVLANDVIYKGAIEPLFGEVKYLCNEFARFQGQKPLV